MRESWVGLKLDEVKRKIYDSYGISYNIKIYLDGKDNIGYTSDDYKCNSIRLMVDNDNDNTIVGYEFH